MHTGWGKGAVLQKVPGCLWSPLIWLACGMRVWLPLGTSPLIQWESRPSCTKLYSWFGCMISCTSLRSGWLAAWNSLGLKDPTLLLWKELGVWRSHAQLQWYVLHMPSVSLSHAFCIVGCSASGVVGRHVGVKHPYAKECAFLLTAPEPMSSDALLDIVFFVCCPILVCFTK